MTTQAMTWRNHLMRKTRQLHLWIGLICSVFIFIEAVTGLLLLEPQLIGGNGGGPGAGGFPQMQQQRPQTPATSGVDANAASPAPRADAGGFPQNGFRGPGRGGDAGANGAGAIGFIRNLHQGRIGSTDIKWVMDIAAIGMMILTVTGIILSTKTLAAQRVRRRKQRIEPQN
jgi:hypothetical protein